MNDMLRERLDEYYEDAGSWASDRQDELRKSRKIAYIIAGVATAIAALEALALVALAPLKTVVPYTLLVDRQTGFVQALDPVSTNTVTADAALTQSFLVQYVSARESFDADALQSNYAKVALWSGEKARAEYIAQMQGTNPESPLRRYPRDTVIETRVKSVSPLAKNVSLVRFDTLRRDISGSAALVGSWAAVVRYRFSTQPMAAEDRYINPLGFQVVRYRRDAEAIPPAGNPATAGQTATTIAEPTIVLP